MTPKNFLSRTHIKNRLCNKTKAISAPIIKLIGHSVKKFKKKNSIFGKFPNFGPFGNILNSILNRSTNFKNLYTNRLLCLLLFKYLTIIHLVRLT